MKGAVCFQRRRIFRAETEELTYITRGWRIMLPAVAGGEEEAPPPVGAGAPVVARWSYTYGGATAE